MKAIVTGGAGFIGSNLCRKLISEGHYVICLDDLSTGKHSNIEEFEESPDFEFVNHDLTKPFFPDTIDGIFNLACPASPIHYQRDPVFTIKTNVNGVINMLGLAKRTKARILQASKSEVYGNPEIHPQTENYWGHVNPIGTRACYD